MIAMKFIHIFYEESFWMIFLVFRRSGLFGVFRLIFLIEFIFLDILSYFMRWESCSTFLSIFIWVNWAKTKVLFLIPPHEPVLDKISSQNDKCNLHLIKIQQMSDARLQCYSNWKQLNEIQKKACLTLFDEFW